MTDFNLDIAIKLLMTVSLALGAQWFKEKNPETFLQYKNWVTLALVVIAAIINPIQYFALNQPILVPNQLALVMLVVSQVVAGAGIGASSTGLYEILKPTNLPFRSVKEVLVDKSAKTGVTEIVETHSSETVPADATVKETEVVYNDKETETTLEVKDVEAASEVVEKKITKSRKAKK
jgi:hypothetical protein